jgi:hypothetical protein
MNTSPLVARLARRPRTHALLLALAVLLLYPFVPGPGARATGSAPAPRPPRVVVAGWYPAERMCEMDAADFAQGLAWSCLRSADRSGWELRIQTPAR